MTQATARPTTAKYAECIGRVWGTHPCIVRLSDGLMIPATGSAARRGEPACPLPANWRGDGYGPAWLKPLGAGRYARLGRMAPVTRPDVIAAADRAFGMA